jgi:hypothetical protein
MPGLGSNYVITPPTPYPATLAGGGVYTSGVIQLGGNGINVAATMTQAGTLAIQRYADVAGTIPVGAAVSTTLVASTAGWTAVNDGFPAISFQVTLTNTSGSTATVSGMAIVVSGS